MIETVIAILLALAGGTACELGTPVDWYDWAYAHPDAGVALATRDLPDVPDAWLYHDAASDDWVLFVFRESISSTLAAGRSDPHGACAVRVTP